MKQFYNTENEFIDRYGQEVGAYAIAVYAVLMRHADSKGNCFPSVSLIAKKIKSSPRQVYRALKSLEQVGAVISRRKKGRHNYYFLPPLSKLSKSEKAIGKPEPWPEDAPLVAFLEPVTCEWGHDFGDEENSWECWRCGLRRSEEYYKEMVYGLH